MKISEANQEILFLVAVVIVAALVYFVGIAVLLNILLFLLEAFI